MTETPIHDVYWDDPAGEIDYYRDPIHDYIPYTTSSSGEVTEKTIIASHWFQRLRRIFQLQCAWLVYPGAKHSRFIHSIGVMHLAGRFAAHLWESYAKNIGTDDLPSKQHVVETCRLAGLLHDIGHGPMGHTLDEIYFKCGYNVTHEDIGKKIITEELSDIITQIRRSPYGPFSEPLDPQIISDMIKPPDNGVFKAEWAKQFSKIITGLYCVDVLDYLMRDSYFCGTKEYGTVDIGRFLNSSFMSKEAGFTLHANCVSVLKSFFYSRFFMYENIYFHHKVRAFDFSFEELFCKAWDHLKIENPVENLERFYKLDDYLLYSIPNLWSEDSNEEKLAIAREWNSILNKNETWKCIYEMQYYPKDPLSKLFHPLDIEAKMKELIYSSLDRSVEIKIDIPYLSLRPENLWKEDNKKIAIYDPYTNSYDDLVLSRIYDEIPFRMLMTRVYTRLGKNSDAVRKAVVNSLSTDSFKAKTSF
jgi:HD superfamily phosphohydrolase